MNLSSSSERVIGAIRQVGYPLVQWSDKDYSREDLAKCCYEQDKVILDNFSFFMPTNDDTKLTLWGAIDSPHINWTGIIRCTFVHSAMPGSDAQPEKLECDTRQIVFVPLGIPSVKAFVDGLNEHSISLKRKRIEQLKWPHMFQWSFEQAKDMTPHIQGMIN